MVLLQRETGTRAKTRLKKQDKTDKNQQKKLNQSSLMGDVFLFRFFQIPLYIFFFHHSTTVSAGMGGGGNWKDGVFYNIVAELLTK